MRQVFTFLAVLGGIILLIKSDARGPMTEREMAMVGIVLLVWAHASLAHMRLDALEKK